jgi:hypothetical protein
LYGIGAVAEGRPRKYPGASKSWPISSLPIGLPSRMTRLPLAACGKANCATPVIASG